MAVLGLRGPLRKELHLPWPRPWPRPRPWVILDIARGDAQLGHAPGEVGLESERGPVVTDEYSAKFSKEQDQSLLSPILNYLADRIISREKNIQPCL